MIKSFNASYRFLPAILTNLGINPIQAPAITFSDFIRKAMYKPVSDRHKKYILNAPFCTNDTGIRACGTQCEHIKNIYVSSDLKTNKGSIILTIQNPYYYKDLYFKGTWDTADMNITIWCELMPERALAEISLFNSID
jgi:hypothetical protein